MEINTFFAFGLPGGSEWLFVCLSLFFGIWWIMTLVEIIKSDYEGENTRLWWLLIVFFLGVIGLLIYKIGGPKPIRD